MPSIIDNLRLVNERIAASAESVGRKREDVTLVTVTKTRSVEEINIALQCGVTDIGENYIQEAKEKHAQLAGKINWHLIGHLQSNKAKVAVQIADLIHGVDSYGLANGIASQARSMNKVAQILLEVNISSEVSKFGAEPDIAHDLAERISELEGIKVCGLMGMAPFLANPEETRPYFRRLKSLWDKLPDEQRLYLSMGMTQDFEIAIQEGANMVRIGTAIFGSRG